MRDASTGREPINQGAVNRAWKGSRPQLDENVLGCAKRWQSGVESGTCRSEFREILGSKEVAGRAES
jgi:hypothetical protein